MSQYHVGAICTPRIDVSKIGMRRSYIGMYFFAFPSVFVVFFLDLFSLFLIIAF